ncbi:hypothetical protein JCM11251_000546 [Rhodosporidiobolus azoricus]
MWPTSVGIDGATSSMACTCYPQYATMTSNPAIVQLKPFLQPFPYGRNGMDSWAAQYALETPSLKKSVEKDGGIKKDQPYGEIWLGSTHQNGPCYVEGQDLSLKDLIKKDPSFYLGSKLQSDKQMTSQYPDDLPFLFKVLSFDKPLPLQCHPDKKLGEQLMQQEKKQEGKNENFVDSNAKPEVGVALSPFTAFVGFRPLEPLQNLIKSVPEFGELFQDSTLSSFYKTASSSPSDADAKAALRSLFYEAINLPEAKVKDLTSRLSARLEKEGAEAVFGAANQYQAKGKANASGESEAAAMARVWKISTSTYGESDPGSLVATTLMNVLRMEKGEGAWILADDLHAYVEGDIIECMANSDNMVAHGLGTEEQGGISTFVEMLSYRHLPPSDLLLKYEDKWSKGKNGRTRRYDVPINEFDLLSISLSSSSPTEELSYLDGPLTYVLTEGTVITTVAGEKLELSKGQAGFVRAGVDIKFEAKNGQPAELWGAFYQ